MTEPLPSGAVVQIEVPSPPGILPAASSSTYMVVPTPGPPGPPGVGASSHLHEQASASAVWDVAHGLDRQVVHVGAIYSTDYSEQYWNVIVEPLTANTCRLFFGSPVAGWALIQS